MSKPETCVCCGRVIPEGSQYCVMCGMGIPKKQKQIDRIRNMSVEELAHLIGDICQELEVCCCPAEIFCQKNYLKLKCNGCEDLILKWLESEVDN